MSITAINSFSGDFEFLSNFYPSMVSFRKVPYPTVEHAYQAAKTRDPGFQLRILRAETPGKAKKMGRTVPLRPDWDEVKIQVMTKLVRRKFQHPHLADMLRATEDAQLVEGNWWGDTFWGVCKGIGENHLGIILMDVRATL